MINKRKEIVFRYIIFWYEKTLIDEEHKMEDSLLSSSNNFGINITIVKFPVTAQIMKRIVFYTNKMHLGNAVMNSEIESFNLLNMKIDFFSSISRWSSLLFQC